MDIALKKNILGYIEEHTSGMTDIVNHFKEYPVSDVMKCLNELMFSYHIKKERGEDGAVFSVNTNEDDFLKPIEEQTESEIMELSDTKVISQLARKFRGSRYHVERDVKKKGIEFSLMIEKKKKKQYIFYLSSAELFSSTKMFERALRYDSSIRIVVKDNSVKMDIFDMFNKYIEEKWEGSSEAFYAEHGLLIIDIKQFFKKTSWKAILQR